MCSPLGESVRDRRQLHICQWEYATSAAYKTIVVAVDCVDCKCRLQMSPIGGTATETGADCFDCRPPASQLLKLRRRRSAAGDAGDARDYFASVTRTNGCRCTRPIRRGYRGSLCVRYAHCLHAVALFHAVYVFFARQHLTKDGVVAIQMSGGLAIMYDKKL